jgi:release factor glutamine methyltransferase
MNQDETERLSTHVKKAATRLSAMTDTPRLDAELLAAHALGLSRSQLLARLRDVVEVPACFEGYIQRRLNHEPIAYIVGDWEFFSLVFICRAPMLVPRPETEHLVEAALDFLGSASIPAPKVLDLCTGTGCVAIAIGKNATGSRVTATDLNPDAVILAKKNAARHHLDVTFHEGDLFAALPENTPPYDAIVSNPPYVEAGDWDTLSPVIRLHEDPGALLSGPDGLDCVRAIVSGAGTHLVPGGLLALEIGEGQAEAVKELMGLAGFQGIGIRKDLAGIARIVDGRRG